MMKKLENHLKDFGIRPSVQRLKVLEYFFRNKNHPTAEQIYEGLNAEMPTLSRATVYNTLGLFKERHLIRTVSSENQNTRYDLTGNEHGHFYCIRCREIYDFPYCYAGSYAQLEGFGIESEEIIVKGVCKRCLEN